jgi:[ribosomal protein S18]-alanine N-acetyltransferase
VNYAQVGADSADVLAALHAEAFDKPWDAGEFARLLALDAAFAILAGDAAPLGFVMGWAPGDEAEILTLAVAASVRRRGVGNGLVNAAIAAALIVGAKSMVLEVAEGNAAARALYARLGFEQIARRGAYYERGGRREDALVLRRMLPRPSF